MLYMVIENFRNADPAPIGERFRLRGRMLPEGLIYHASWMDSKGGRCFQVMETQDPALLTTWIKNWDDLIDFEVIPVQTSAEFWSNFRAAEPMAGP
jgi:Protein of unknown function (DUF3303)